MAWMPAYVAVSNLRSMISMFRSQFRCYGAGTVPLVVATKSHCKTAPVRWLLLQRLFSAYRFEKMHCIRILLIIFLFCIYNQLNVMKVV
jgi:hypothetical protein